MILTIALNPGIEKHIKIGRYEEGAIVDVDRYDLRIAGSSIYAAYIMRLLQAEPYVLGFAGGIGGRYIKNFLDKNRIKSNLITKDKELKTTIIINADNGTTTRLVDDEEAFIETDAKNLKHKLVTQIDGAELFVINGDITHSGSRDILMASIDLVQKAHKRLVLALEGDQILPFVECSPYAILLDEGQVEILTDGSDDLEESLECLRQLAIKNHIHYIFFPSGDQIIGVTRNKISYGYLPDETPALVVWEKHAVLGGLAIGVKRKYEFEKMLKLMTSVRYAISEDNYPSLCTRKDIDLMKNKAKVVDYFRADAYRIEEVQHGL